MIYTLKTITRKKEKPPSSRRIFRRKTKAYMLIIKYALRVTTSLADIPSASLTISSVSQSG